jgi:HlyD family secretion protein
VAKLSELSTELGDKSEGFIAEQRRNIEKTQRLTRQLNESLGKQLETIRQLRLEGLSSQDLVLNAETNMADSEMRIANLDVQRQELEMQEIRQRQTQLDQENRRSDLALQLMQLDIAAQRAISRVELRLERESRIVADCDGTILEVAIQPGQVVGLGMRVGTVEMDDPDGELTNLSFFSVADGKRIAVGDSARVTPSTVQREREGSIVGRVRRVSPFPVTQESVINNVGNAEIAQTLLRQGGAIEVEVDLERDFDSYSGFRWTSKDPEKKFSAGTTTTVRITIEQRAPITYLLPILRTWLMGAKDAQTPDL